MVNLEDKDEREKVGSNSVEKEQNRVGEAAKNEKEQIMDGREKWRLNQFFQTWTLTL